MSGGISAIKGFDYQATVILDRLFDHFDWHGPEATARPEGIDDLDLIWTADTVEYRRYVQIKKPKEDQYGNLKPAPWTLSAAIEELFPNTISHLSGNSDTQAWILGDKVADELNALVGAGESAPGVETVVLDRRA
jgi:predicted GNAT superfamily acetyltransferase